MGALKDVEVNVIDLVDENEIYIADKNDYCNGGILDDLFKLNNHEVDLELCEKKTNPFEF